MFKKIKQKFELNEKTTFHDWKHSKPAKRYPVVKLMTNKSDIRTVFGSIVRRLKLIIDSIMEFDLVSSEYNYHDMRSCQEYINDVRHTN